MEQLSLQEWQLIEGINILCKSLFWKPFEKKGG